MAEEPPAGRHFRIIPLICASLTIALGLLTLIGWISGLPLLASVRVNYIPMAPSFALCFSLIGVGLIAHIWNRTCDGTRAPHSTTTVALWEWKCSIRVKAGQAEVRARLSLSSLGEVKESRPILLPVASASKNLAERNADIS
jgi:hypothetical protein